MAVAAAGTIAPSARARAATFLRWWLRSMVLCLLWLAIAGCDRIGGTIRVGGEGALRGG